MKVLWNNEIRTDKVITVRKQDVVIIDKTKRTTIMIGVAILPDWNVIDKEDEMILKYQDLRIEIQKLWTTKAKFMPIVVVSLDATLKKFEKLLREISGKQLNSIN